MLSFYITTVESYAILRLQPALVNAVKGSWGNLLSVFNSGTFSFLRMHFGKNCLQN